VEDELHEMKYKFLKHTADIKFQSYGKTLEQAFENAALAMFNSMYKKKVEAKKKKKISVEGRDLESLLYNFLEELLFLLDTENLFLSKVKIKIDKEKLKLNGEVIGDDASNYSIGLDVKAITYNQMFVKKQKNKYTCQVILDV
jgi:SHS2 domain-containing protein